MCFLLTVWGTGGENYGVTLSVFFGANYDIVAMFLQLL